MSTDASFSPDDLIALQRELAHTQSVLAETAVTCQAQQTRIEQLQAEIELLKRYLYGRRSERFVEDPAQGRLFEQPAGVSPAPELPEAAQEEVSFLRRRKGHGWSELPAHLPREVVPVDVPEAERRCPCCGEPMQCIGEDRSERVDYRPAKIVVKVLVRPKYACPKKHGNIKQAPVPVSPVPGGRFDFGLVAQVVTSKILRSPAAIPAAGCFGSLGLGVKPLNHVRDLGWGGVSLRAAGSARQASAVSGRHDRSR
jgi:transposase